MNIQLKQLTDSNWIGYIGFTAKQFVPAYAQTGTLEDVLLWIAAKTKSINYFSN